MAPLCCAVFSGAIAVHGAHRATSAKCSFRPGSFSGGLVLPSAGSGWGGAGGLGRDVPLTAAEASGTVDLVEQVLSKLYQSLFTR